MILLALFWSPLPRAFSRLSRATARAMEAVNLAAFGRRLRAVARAGGAGAGAGRYRSWDGFLYADPLSALVCC